MVHGAACRCWICCVLEGLAAGFSPAAPMKKPCCGESGAAEASRTISVRMSTALARMRRSRRRSRIIARILHDDGISGRQLLFVWRWLRRNRVPLSKSAGWQWRSRATVFATQLGPRRSSEAAAAVERRAPISSCPTIAMRFRWSIFCSIYESQPDMPYVECKAARSEPLAGVSALGRLQESRPGGRYPARSRWPIPPCAWSRSPSRSGPMCGRDSRCQAAWLDRDADLWKPRTSFAQAHGAHSRTNDGRGLAEPSGNQRRRHDPRLGIRLVGSVERKRREERRQWHLRSWNGDRHEYPSRPLMSGRARRTRLWPGAGPVYP